MAYFDGVGAIAGGAQEGLEAILKRKLREEEARRAEQELLMRQENAQRELGLREEENRANREFREASTKRADRQEARESERDIRAWAKEEEAKKRREDQLKEAEAILNDPSVSPARRQAARLVHAGLLSSMPAEVFRDRRAELEDQKELARYNSGLVEGRQAADDQRAVERGAQQREAALPRSVSTEIVKLPSRTNPQTGKPFTYEEAKALIAAKLPGWSGTARQLDPSAALELLRDAYQQAPGLRAVDPVEAALLGGGQQQQAQPQEYEYVNGKLVPKQ